MLKHTISKNKKAEEHSFADLVSYIDCQAKIVIDPLFGNIPDSCSSTTGKTDYKEGHPAKREVRGSSFATNVSNEKQQPSGTCVKSVIPSKIGTASEKPCLYCQKFHTLASCNKIKKNAATQGMLLKSKGLCFVCLTNGHLSKFCKRRIECKDCALKLPDILHTVKKKISVSSQKVLSHLRRIMELTKMKCHVLKFLSCKNPVALFGLENLNVCCQLY